MSALREVDRDLDQIVVDAARLAEVRKGVAARGKLALAVADDELAALAAGTAALPAASYARPDTEPPPPPDASALEDEGPPSGQIDVPDHVLASAELPAVLAMTPERPAAEPLSLELDSGETPLGGDEELAPIATTASMVLPVEAPAAAAAAVEHYAPPAESQLGADPTADLASLLGDSDPMRDEGAMPLAGSEIEPEPTTMFTAEDAERYSRPPSALESLEDLEPASDIELDIEEIDLEEDIEEEEAAPAAAAPRTAPPPPPRTAPPPPPGTRPSEAPAPGRGFLGKLLQRKP